MPVYSHNYSHTCHMFMCHRLMQSYCHSRIVSYSHRVIFFYSHLLTVSQSHILMLSYSRTLMLSYSHTRTFSFCRAMMVCEVQELFRRPGKIAQAVIQRKCSRVRISWRSYDSILPQSHILEIWHRLVLELSFYHDVASHTCMFAVKQTLILSLSHTLILS